MTIIVTMNDGDKRTFFEVSYFEIFPSCIRIYFEYADYKESIQGFVATVKRIV